MVKRVDFDELDIDDMQVHLFDGEPFSGVAFEVDSEGRLVCEVTFVDGIEQGPTRDWYPSGQLKSEDNRVRGAAHGLKRAWHPNGQLRLEERYEHGICLERRRWNADGQLEEHYTISPDDRRLELLPALRRHAGNDSDADD